MGDLADRGDPTLVQAAPLPHGQGFGQHLFQLHRPPDPGLDGQPGQLQREPDLVGGEPAHRARLVGGHHRRVVTGAAAGELRQNPGLAGLRPRSQAFEPDHRIDQLRIRQPGHLTGIGIDLQGEQPGRGGVAPGAVLHTGPQLTFDGQPVEGVLKLGIDGVAGLHLADTIEHTFDRTRSEPTSQRRPASQATLGQR
nr:hypothetical protein [Pseudonocardia sp. DSM 110487]